MHKTEMAMNKKVLFAAVDVLPDVSRKQANVKISEAVTDALEALPEDQRDIIDREAHKLMSKVKGLGILGALELIASVSEYL